MAGLELDPGHLTNMISLPHAERVLATEQHLLQTALFCMEENFVTANDTSSDITDYTKQRPPP